MFNALDNWLINEEQFQLNAITWDVDVVVVVLFLAYSTAGFSSCKRFFEQFFAFRFIWSGIQRTGRNDSFDRHFSCLAKFSHFTLIAFELVFLLKAVPRFEYCILHSVIMSLRYHSGLIQTLRYHSSLTWKEDRLLMYLYIVSLWFVPIFVINSAQSHTQELPDELNYKDWTKITILEIKYTINWNT